MWNNLKRFWQGIRHLTGEDAYERYLAHFALHHPSDCDNSSHDLKVGDAALNKKILPLTKEEFYKQWQDEKWKKVNRCC